MKIKFLLITIGLVALSSAFVSKTSAQTNVAGRLSLSGSNGDYCIPTYKSTYDGYVQFHKVSFGNFTKKGWHGGTYYDLTGRNKPMHYVYIYQAGKTYDFKTKNLNQMQVTAWIDFNNNKIFEESERIMSRRKASGGWYESSWKVTIPNVKTGRYVMRIRGAMDSDKGEACGYAKYGQTIDIQTYIFGNDNLKYCEPEHASTKNGLYQFHELSIGDFSMHKKQGGTYLNLGGENMRIYNYKQGMSYTFSTKNPVTMMVTAWIDYNDNGTFEESERILPSKNAPGNGRLASWKIDIPVNAPPGKHRMRIRGDWLGSSFPCAYSRYGQTIDINANIVPGVVTKSASPENNDYMEEMFDEELMSQTSPVVDLNYSDAQELSLEEGLEANSEPIYPAMTNCEKYNLAVFPNPTNGKLGIRIDDVEDISNIRILSPYGSTVKELEISNIINTDISDLAPGLYFVEVLDKYNQPCTRKIIKR